MFSDMNNAKQFKKNITGSPRTTRCPIVLCIKIITFDYHIRSRLSTTFEPRDGGPIAYTRVEQIIYYLYHNEIITSLFNSVLIII